MPRWAAQYARSALHWTGVESGGVAERLLRMFKGEKAFFIYGFAKNERSDVTPGELEALKVLAKKMLDLTPAQLAAAVRSGELIKLEV